VAQKQTLRLEGLSDLKEAMQDLTKATQGNVLKRAVMAGGAVIAEDATARAPVDDGDLKRNILVSRAKIISPGKAAFAQAMRETGDRGIAAQAARNANRTAGGSGRAATCKVGPTKSVGQGILQEFGTAHHRPQPFMRPAWDTKKVEAAETVKTALAEEIQKAVDRAARRAAKIRK
jgi:HK97 gp10 family phage protein